MKKKFYKLKGKMRILNHLRLRLSNEVDVDHLIESIRQVIVNDVTGIYLMSSKSFEKTKLEKFKSIIKIKYHNIPGISNLKIRRDTPDVYILNLVIKDVENYVKKGSLSKLGGTVKLTNLFTELELINLGKCKRYRKDYEIERLIVNLLRED